MRKGMSRASTIGAILLMISGCGGATTTPTGRDPGIVELAGALGNRFVPAGTSSEVVARLRISTNEVAGARRPPINLALVVDTSGSMEGQPIADARAAAESLLDSLRPGDRLAVVAFHSTTEALLPSTLIEPGHLAELRARIHAMEARGTTDLAGGLQMGLEEVTRHFDARGINRVVLLSDGVPNDATMVRPLAQAAGERNIAITTLGLGLDYDEVLLGDVAVASGGRFHYVETSSAVASVFRDEVLRMTRTVARNVTVELAPGPGVAIASVVGPAFTTSGGRVYVSVGNIAEGEVRDILVRMTVEGRRAGAAVELFDTRLSFDDAAFDAGHFERSLYLGARATDSTDELARGRDVEVERDAARFMAAAVTVEAIRLARGGELDRARAILAEATIVTRSYAESSGDSDLAGRAERMAALDGYLPGIASTAPAAPSYGGGASPSDYAYDEVETESAVRSAHDDAMSTLSGGW